MECSFPTKEVSIGIKENFQNDKVASQHNSKNRILVQENETHFSRVSIVR
jgi:hypothetical protein